MPNLAGGGRIRDDCGSHEAATFVALDGGFPPVDRDGAAFASADLDEMLNTLLAGATDHRPHFHTRIGSATDHAAARGVADHLRERVPRRVDRDCQRYRQASLSRAPEG